MLTHTCGLGFSFSLTRVPWGSHAHSHMCLGVLVLTHICLLASIPCIALRSSFLLPHGLVHISGTAIDVHQGSWFDNAGTMLAYSTTALRHVAVRTHVDDNRHSDVNDNRHSDVNDNCH
jgi:hypothetical protein